MLLGQFLKPVHLQDSSAWYIGAKECEQNQEKDVYRHINKTDYTSHSITI
jgi:hypothetical protein